MKTSEKALGMVCATINTAVSAIQFVTLLILAQNAVKIFRKFTAFLALASMIPLGIAELAFVIFVYAHYYHARSARTLLHRILVVTGAQGLVFASIVLVRLLVYSPYARATHNAVIAVLRSVDWVQLVAGLVGGAGLIALSLLAGKRGKRAVHHQ